MSMLSLTAPVMRLQETVVRSDSSDRAVQLARRLKGAGARMFGAFWCSHCQEQKLMFGKQAQGDLPYVECFPEGWRKVRCPVQSLVQSQ